MRYGGGYSVGTDTTTGPVAAVVAGTSGVGVPAEADGSAESTGAVVLRGR
jgi:hypothetical protein